MATKQELEQQLADAIAVAQKLNKEIKQLTAENKNLSTANNQLTKDLSEAMNRVRYLAGEIKLLELQRQSSTQYSDNSRNY